MSRAYRVSVSQVGMTARAARVLGDSFPTKGMEDFLHINISDEELLIATQAAEANLQEGKDLFDENVTDAELLEASQEVDPDGEAHAVTKVISLTVHQLGR